MVAQCGGDEQNKLDQRMMTRVLAVLFLVFVCGVNTANPLIAIHPAYMSAEQLQVILRNEVAEIDGRFHFRSLAKKGANKGGPWESANALFEVLIWIPSDPNEADAATAALLRVCDVSSGNVLNDGNRAAWDSAIGLKISVGGYPRKFESISVFDPNSKDDRQRLPAEWFRRGFYTIIVRVEFRPDVLAEDPEFRVQYRQGLRRAAAGNEFFYVPMFWNLPADQTTRDLRQYSMYLANFSGQSASLGTATVPIGYATMLPLAHHEPIAVTLRFKE